MRLSKQNILEADDLAVREERVPEWCACDAKGDSSCECTVLIKALSGKERAAYLGSIVKYRGNKGVPDIANIAAKLVARVLVDEDGRRMFVDAEISALGEKSAAALERLFEIATDMSGLSDEDIAEAAENFDEEASDGSTSDSPETSPAPSKNSSSESALVS